MAFLLGAILFAFGLIVGSFLNVVIYRYQTGYTLAGRSECLNCGTQLRWFELLPLFSFLLQLGRCRSCLGRISWQYFLVELSLGIIFLTSWRQAGMFMDWSLIFDWLIFCLLLVITVYDWRHKIIPDQFVYAFIVLALLGAVWRPETGQAAFTGLALFTFFGLLWLMSRGRWLGLGDAKLALGFGLFLGWPAALSAVVLAFWSGALVGLALILSSALRREKSYNMKSELPFAPFLCFGVLVVYLFKIDVVTFFL